MKNTLTRKALSFFLAVLMVFGVASTGLIVVAQENDNTINYVSIGDSMANGYGFVGYKQDSNDRNDYDFMTGKGMYGDGAYPNQFEAYLESKGYTVNHTKLAASAMLAEDLLYLLGGREEFNDGWGGYKDYVGTYTDDELMPYIQNAITEADIITMGIGNAAFGAFLLNRITDALGVFGASLDEDEKVNFEDAIAVLELDAEQYELVMNVYNGLVAKLVAEVPAEIADEYNLDEIVDLISYTVASYVVNYKLLVEKILEMNPDVEIVLVGLLNTTYGMNVTDDNGEVILPFGDVMDDMFEALNAYMAGIPAIMQAKGDADEAKIYYAAQPEPKFICQQFENLLDDGWGDIQDNRLSGTTIRDRNIDAFNDSLGYMIGMAVTDAPLARISLADVQAYEAIDFDALKAQVEAAGMGAYWSPWAAFYFNGYIADQQTAIDRILAVSIYLAIEEAVARSTNTMDIQLSGLMKIAGDLSSVFTDLGTPPTNAPEATRIWLLNGLSTDEIQGMCKIYGLFKVGNGMSVHPTPEGHDEIAKAVIAAYENKFTAGDHMDALVKPYIDEAINYFKALGLELLGTLENLRPVAEELEAELKVLNGELEAKVIALAEKLAELTEKEEVILADMLAEREALAAELEALEEELAGIYAEPVSANGLPTKKMSATTVADTEEEFVTELEAAIAETKAAIAELDAAIIYVKNQIETDKSGIEAIEAAIEAIKANIAEAEAALAEVNARMITLTADLVELGKALVVLGEAAKGLYDITLGEIDEEIYEAVKTVIEITPAVVDAIEDIYDETVVAIEKAQAAAQAAKDYAEIIMANAGSILDSAENLLASAEKLVAIEGEKAAAVKATAEEIYDLAEAFVIDNLPTVEAALKATAGEIEDIIKEEIAKAEALWAEYDEVVFAALYVAYVYCEDNGYIDYANDFVENQKLVIETKLEDLKADLKEAEATLEAKLEELNEWLNEEYPKVEKELEALKAELQMTVDAETRAALEALIEKLEAKKAALEAKIEEAKVVAAKIEAYIETVEAAIEEVEKALEDVCAKIEVVGTDIEAVLEALCALKGTLCDLGSSIGDLNAAIEDEVLKLLGYANLINEKILAVIDSLDVYADLFADGVAITKSRIIEAIDTFCAYVELFKGKVMEVVEIIEKLIKIGVAAKEEILKAIDLLYTYAEIFADKVATTKAEIIKLVDALYEYLNLFVDDVIKTKNEFIKVLEDLMKDGKLTVDEFMQAMKDLVAGAAEATKNELLKAVEGILEDGKVTMDEIIEAMETLIYNATHADYEINEDSYYVAFGDSTAVSESYVDLLAKELGIKYNNLAQTGLKVEDMFDIIGVNVAEIEKADLITIGFGNNTFITEAINNALNYESAPEYDWVKYVGEDGAEYVAQALAELKATLDEEGLGELAGISVSDLAVTAVESYAYSCVAYAVNLPMIADMISQINPEALVILVGTYNPLDGVVIDLGETKLDISEYLDYLAQAAGLESLIYSIVTDNAIYVDAPDVETKLTDNALDLLDIMKEFAIEQGANLDPSAAGHEYIKDQILGALNITEEAEKLIGDANNDGAVNSIDAMYILQYDVELIDASEINLVLADVNGDGKVNSIDAMYVLRYDAELIEKFPVENKAA